MGKGFWDEPRLGVLCLVWYFVMYSVILKQYFPLACCPLSNPAISCHVVKLSVFSFSIWSILWLSIWGNYIWNIFCLTTPLRYREWQWEYVGSKERVFLFFSSHQISQSLHVGYSSYSFVWYISLAFVPALLFPIFLFPDWYCPLLVTLHCFF